MFSHYVSALLAVSGTILLAMKSYQLGDPGFYIAAFLIYGITVFLMFASSSTYHQVNVSESKEEIFRLLDHMMIYFSMALSSAADVALVTMDFRGTPAQTLAECKLPAVDESNHPASSEVVEIRADSVAPGVTRLRRVVPASGLGRFSVAKIESRPSLSIMNSGSASWP